MTSIENERAQTRDNPTGSPTRVDPEEAARLWQLLGRKLPTGAGISVCTPAGRGFRVFANPTTLEEYGDAVHQAASTKAQAIYVSVNAYNLKALEERRTTKPGARGTKREIAATLAIVADLDMAHGKHSADKPLPDKTNVEELLDGLPTPTLVVDSGGGRHVWWILTEPITDSTIAQDVRMSVRNVLHRNTSQLGVHVDLGVTTDAARILRVPGSTNHKRPEDPRPVRILSEGAPVELSQLLDLDEVSERSAAAQIHKPAPTSRTFTAPERTGWVTEAVARLDEGVSWADLLGSRGWTHVSTDSEGEHYRRPGGENLKSATVHRDTGRLMVWSEASVFGEATAANGQRRTFDKLDAAVILDGGTPDGAGRVEWLRRHGYAPTLEDRGNRTAANGRTGAPGDDYSHTDSQAGTDLEEVEEPWEDPLPISTHVDLALDLSGLPTYLRELVTAQVEQSQSPTEVVLGAALGTLAAATRGVWNVQVTPSWDAGPTCLWVTTLAGSGERKGAGQNPIVKPLSNAERKARQDVAAQNRLREGRRSILAAQLKEAQRATPEPDPELVERLTAQLYENRDRPVPHLVTSDTTTEALGQHMTRQGGASAIFSTEATAFSTVAGHYSEKGANVGLLNKAYDGDEYHDLRVKREAAKVQRPTLTWCTAVQPEVLAGYADAGTEGSGFLARFLLFSPPSKVGTRSMRTEPVPERIIREWSDIVERIHDTSWKHYGEMTDDLENLGEPLTLTLTEEAAEAMLQYGELLERSNTPGSPLRSLGGWSQKHPARVARIAAVLAIAENPRRLSVEVEHVAAALSLADALVRHALATFATLRDTRRREPEVQLLAALRDIGTAEVATRDVHRKVHGQGWISQAEQPAEALRAALEHLVDAGWLQGPENRTGPRGGRPTEVWALHPELRSRVDRDKTHETSTNDGSIRAATEVLSLLSLMTPSEQRGDLNLSPSISSANTSIPPSPDPLRDKSDKTSVLFEECLHGMAGGGEPDLFVGGALACPECRAAAEGVA